MSLVYIWQWWQQISSLVGGRVDKVSGLEHAPLVRSLTIRSDPCNQITNLIKDLNTSAKDYLIMIDKDRLPTLPLMYWTLAALGMSSSATHTLPTCKPPIFQ